MMRLRLTCYPSTRVREESAARDHSSACTITTAARRHTCGASAAITHALPRRSSRGLLRLVSRVARRGRTARSFFRRLPMMRRSWWTIPAGRA